MPVILDLKTVSLIFDVTELTIRRWLYKGNIIGQRIGRKWMFEKDYIKALLENNDARKADSNIQ